MADLDDLRKVLNILPTTTLAMASQVRDSDPSVLFSPHNSAFLFANSLHRCNCAHKS